MRLYISSYRTGNATQELIRMARGNMRAVVINNASDYGTPDKRAEQMQKQVDMLVPLGFQVEEIDLRQYFGKPEELENKLEGFGLVWLKGGKSFVLKRAIEESGFEVIIKKMLASDSIIYGGYSAGGVVASATMRGIELVEDALFVPEGYRPEFEWNGMNLIPYSFVPHYRSNHSSAEAMEKIVAYFEAHNMPYKALRDGEVIVVDGDKEWIAGKPDTKERV
ncbi:MAG: Type 1 glutamine amidotransferase-like domain-containing protein [Candidatus Pacebacteria bacterium]|nr:Type 1 glutamine amidotransferase-like domain-containing protein [Candidatus Paceibacterota bacterium]